MDARFVALALLLVFGAAFQSEASASPQEDAQVFLSLRKKAGVLQPFDGDLVCGEENLASDVLPKQELPTSFTKLNYPSLVGRKKELETLAYFLFYVSGVAPSERARAQRLVSFVQALFVLKDKNLIIKPDLKSSLSPENNPFWGRAEKRLELLKPKSGEALAAYNFVIENDGPLDHDEPNERISVEALSLIAFNKPPACGMSAREWAALSGYLGGAYYEMNSYLRNRTSKSFDPTIDAMADALAKAIAKVQAYQGPVLRSTNYGKVGDLPESVYREHAKGAVVKYKGFTSSSIEKNFEGNVVIMSRRGRFINPLEGEVLFKNDTRFLVKYNSCESENKPKWQDCNMILEEVEDSRGE